MAKLSQLPNEMMAEIWRRILEPRDVESFALASKQAYAIGRPFVKEHNKLKREYSLFETGPNTRASAPALLLKDVLLRPRVALYVAHLFIGRYQLGWQDSSGDGDGDVLYSKNWPKTRHVPYPEDDMALFVEATRTASFVSRQDVEHWITRIKAGDEDPILALLSLLLPKLTTITLRNEGENGIEFHQTIQRIAEAENGTFLTRLTTVNLHNGFEYYNNYMDIEWLKVLATLPRMQSIHLNRMRITEHWAVDDEQYFRPGSSNITELTFDKSNIGPKTMFQLLESIKTLKKFSHSDPDEEVHEFEPFWIRAALLAHAKHSLESLRITSSPTEETKLLGTFRNFTALRELETNVHLLINVQPNLLEASINKLGDLLPASIEKIHLHSGDHWCWNRIPQLVETFVEAKTQLLPNLRSVKLSSEPQIWTTQADKDLIKNLEEMCWDVGVELTVIAG